MRACSRETKLARLAASRPCFAPAEAVAVAISESPARPMRRGRQNGRTGLIQAAQNGHRDVIRLLLEHAADVKAADTVRARWMKRGGGGGVVEEEDASEREVEAGVE